MGAAPHADIEAGGFVGKHLGRFHLVAELGRGGMGVVYEVHQSRTALKTLGTMNAEALVLPDRAPPLRGHPRGGGLSRGG
jgi:hypothetical protein